MPEDAPEQQPEPEQQPPLEGIGSEEYFSFFYNCCNVI